LSRLLAGSGFGSSRLTVLEALGGPRERLRATTAAGFDLDEVGPLNTVAIEVEASLGARVLARAPGLPDALFEPDGQITKRGIRGACQTGCIIRRRRRDNGARRCGARASHWRTVGRERRDDRNRDSPVALSVYARWRTSSHRYYARRARGREGDMASSAVRNP